MTKGEQDCDTRRSQGRPGQVGGPREPFPGLTGEAGDAAPGALGGGAQEETKGGSAQVPAHQLCDYRASLLATSTSSPLLPVYDIELPGGTAEDSGSQPGFQAQARPPWRGAETAARCSAAPSGAPGSDTPVPKPECQPRFVCIALAVTRRNCEVKLAATAMTSGST